MTEKEKKGFLQKFFGKKSGCCSIELEQVEENNQNKSGTRQDQSKGGCCSTDKEPDRK